MSAETSPDTPDAPDTPETDVRMTIWEHLSELRSRLMRAALAVVVCGVVAWCFRVEILGWLIAPFNHAWVERFGEAGGKPELQTLSPGDVFVGYLQLSLVTGVVASVPIIFYQLWAFISPGLYKKEKRLIVPFVLFSTMLFLAGVAFAYYVAFPFTFKYFLSLLGDVNGEATLVMRPTLEQYLDFQTRMLLAFGIVFELPLFLSFLVIGNIVKPKQLLKFGRWAILLAFIIGAFVTPGPEISSQIAVSGALIGLYYLSIVIAYVLRPPRKEEADASPPKAK